MKSLLTASALVLASMTLGSAAQAAPLSAAPVAVVDVADAKTATEPVTFRRHHGFRYRVYRPYSSFYYAAPVRECWWRHGRRHCVVRSYW
ncbi:MAG: hypothetical protein ABL898_11845 [Hyphomicrobiaceae bacterium]|nr:hypothetical protein [Hyphomicrobiaceae bacterium]